MYLQLGIALVAASLVMLIPRPEGKRFGISGDGEKRLLAGAQGVFRLSTQADVGEEMGTEEADFL